MTKQLTPYNPPLSPLLSPSDDRILHSPGEQQEGTNPGGIEALCGISVRRFSISILVYGIWRWPRLHIPFLASPGWQN